MPRVYECIARAIVARKNNAHQSDANSIAWFDRHTERVESLIREHLPRGSGFDRGTTIDWDKSTPERLVFNTAFHHMDDNGFYDGWSEHSVIVTPSLSFGFDLRVTGRDRRQIKEFIGDTFHRALAELLENEY